MRHRWTGVHNATSFNKNNVEDQKQVGTLLQVKNISRQEKREPFSKKGFSCMLS